MEKGGKREKKLSENTKIILYAVLGAVIVLLLFNLGKPISREVRDFLGLGGRLRSVGVFSAGGSGGYTCEDAYGSDYKTCPGDVEKGSEDYAECCDSDETCCHDNKNVEPICCSTETYEGERLYVCGEFHGEVAGTYVEFNYCKVNKCKPPKSQMCTRGFGTICCLPEPQQYCGEMDGGAPNTPFCAVKSKHCPAGTFECYRENIWGSEDYILCCQRATESCDSDPVAGKKVCNARLCNYGETLCRGIGDFSWVKVCCKIGEICFHQPNGVPECT